MYVGLLLRCDLARRTFTITFMSDIYRDSIFWVEVERIKPNPFQPRRDFDKDNLNSLAESIRMYGLLQPLTVTRNETAKDDGGITVEYELIAGERRLRASKIAGLTQVPVIIRSGQDTDQMKLELAIIENLQREDLNPVDRAKAFLRLHKEFKFTHSEIGKKVGKSREYVSNTLRLLGLPDFILTYLSEGRIVEGHTRPLLMLSDRPEEQSVLAKEILLKRLTVRESETYARRIAQDRVTARHRIDPVILNLERKLTERLGTRVQIEQREVGGKLVINFFSAEDLSTLLENMRFEEERESVAGMFDGNRMVPKAPEEKPVETVLQNSEPISEPEIIAVDLEDSPLSETTPQTQPEEMEGVSAESAVEESLKSVADSSGDEVSVVTPDPERPMPEEAGNIVEEPASKPEVRQAENLEEEEDLYSIRNFSI